MHHSHELVCARLWPDVEESTVDARDPLDQGSFACRNPCAWQEMPHVWHLSSAGNLLETSSLQ